MQKLFAVALGLFLGQVLSLDTSTCFCTTVPCPVVGVNYLSEGGGANGTYIYINHNGIPVVASASVTITSADLNKGSDTTSCTQDYSRSLDDDGTKDCDAGHILANRLGGPGKQPINIFPQDLHINRGSYREFEESIYNCIVWGASTGSLSWTFSYVAETNTKPNTLTYKAEFTGGNCSTLYSEFTNYN